MEYLPEDIILHIVFYLTEFKCGRAIHENTTPLIVSKVYYRIIKNYIKYRKIDTKICLNPRIFIDDLINTGVFSKSYPENYGYSKGSLVRLINTLSDWKCITHPPDSIKISEKGRKEWPKKIKQISRQLLSQQKDICVFGKSITVHFDTAKELPIFMEFMVRLGLNMNYDFHTCCSGKGIMWKLKKYKLR